MLGYGCYTLNAKAAKMTGYSHEEETPQSPDMLRVLPCAEKQTQARRQMPSLTRAIK